MAGHKDDRTLDIDEIPMSTMMEVGVDAEDRR